MNCRDGLTERAMGWACKEGLSEQRAAAAAPEERCESGAGPGTAERTTVPDGRPTPSPALASTIGAGEPRSQRVTLA